MVNFHKEITDLHYQVYNLKEQVEVFESWIYANTDFEAFFGEEKYLDVISLDFKSREATYKLDLMINEYVDHANLEKRNLIKVLESSIEYRLEQGVCFGELYELYCKGYYFLFDLVLGYGLPYLNGSNYQNCLGMNLITPRRWNYSLDLKGS